MAVAVDGPGLLLSGRDAYLLAGLLAPVVAARGERGPALTSEQKIVVNALFQTATNHKVQQGFTLKPALPDGGFSEVGWCSTAEAAARLGITTQAVSKAVRSGGLTARRAGRGREINLASLQRYETRRAQRQEAA